MSPVQTMEGAQGVTVLLLCGLAALAGICFYAGLNHLQISRGRPQRIWHQVFALMCFSVSAVAAMTISLHWAPTPADVVFRVRWMVALVMVPCMFGPWLVAVYTLDASRRPAIAISAAYGVLFLANWILPYGLTFVQMPMAGRQPLPLSQWFTGAALGAGPWRLAFWTMHGVHFAYIFYRCAVHFRSGKRRRALALGGSTFFLFLCVANNVLVSLGISQFFPHSAQFGFLALVLFMSFVLHGELRGTDRQMRAVLDHVPAIIFVKDLAGRLTYVNRHFLRSFRFSRDAVIGRTDIDLFPAQQAQCSRAEDAEVLRLKRACNYEERVEEQGTARTYLTLKFPLFNRNGAPYAVGGVATDITERKRTERALHRSEAYTGLLLDSTEQGILGVDNRGRCTQVNRAALALLGYGSADELIGRRAVRLLHRAEHRAATFNGVFDAVRSSLERGRRGHCAEVRCRRRDGRSFPAECWTHPIRNEGEIAGAVITFQDITERKRVDESIRALAAMPPAEEGDAFFHHCVRHLANAFGVRFAFISLLNEARTHARTLATWDNGVVVSSTEYAILEGTPCHEVVNRSKCLISSGAATLYPHAPFVVENRIESYLGTPIRSAAGEVIGVLGVLGEEPLHVGPQSESLLDVFANRISAEMERKLALEGLRGLSATLEKRVSDRTAELSRINDELEAFSYSVSHDLRAPLTAMGGFSGLLLRHYSPVLDDSGKRYLRRIADGAQRMSELIEALLSLGRINRQEMHLRQVDLSALAAASVRRLQEVVGARPVSVRIATNLSAVGDRRLLTVVFDNLFQNAWKYTGLAAAPSVEVGEILQSQERVFYVRDNGIGFDPRYAGRLFQPFQRLHNRQEFPGTGIGLATVARIIRRHGGRIWAESTPDQGATFFFTLPGEALS